MDADKALHYRDWVNNDRLVARHLTEYGFKYKNETQHLENGYVVYGTGLFGHAFCVDNNYEVSYHHNATTWASEKWSRSQKRKFFFDKIGMLPVYNKLENLKKALKKSR